MKETVLLIARWSSEASSGHQQAVIDIMTRWQKEVGREIGWKEVRLLSRAVRGLEPAVLSEIRLKELAEPSATWDKLAKNDAHKNWGKELEPHIVSGKPRRKVLRVLYEES